MAGVHDLSGLRFRLGVFRDRRHAGEVLAAMLDGALPPDAAVLGIPAGGMPVAVEIATRLALPLEAVVASPITLPWDAGTGYGAVAFDGTVHLDRAHVAYFDLDPATIQAGVDAARQRVDRCMGLIYGAQGCPRLEQHTAVVVDDGLATGATMTAAISALRALGARAIVVAVPTGHDQAAIELAARVNDVYCANLHTGASFSVAGAYLHWADVPEQRAAEVLHGFERRVGARRPS